MKLRCKIYPKYLKEILGGFKSIEYRQFETITFIDSETGEEHTFEIEGLWMCGERPAKDIFKMYPDVKWDLKKPVFGIKLGKEARK